MAFYIGSETLPVILLPAVSEIMACMQAKIDVSEYGKQFSDFNHTLNNIIDAVSGRTTRHDY